MRSIDALVHSIASRHWLSKLDFHSCANQLIYWSNPLYVSFCLEFRHHNRLIHHNNQLMLKKISYFFNVATGTINWFLSAIDYFLKLFENLWTSMIPLHYNYSWKLFLTIALNHKYFPNTDTPSRGILWCISDIYTPLSSYF